MLRNYLKIGIRNIRRGKVYSAINLLGLTLGTTVCILIMLFVLDEYSFDKFHDKSDRIYRVWVKEHFQGEIFFNTVTPFILGSELKDNIPELEEVSQYMIINSLVRNGTFTDQESVHLVEKSFLEIFDFSLLEGEPDHFSNDLHHVLITEEMSRKYFGSAAPMGEVISLQIGGEWTDFSVAGIIEKAPSNSSIQYDFLIPFKNVESFTSPGMRQNWMSVTPETYVLLRPDTDMTALNGKIAEMVDSKVADDYDPGEYVVGLQPINDIHLNAEIPVGIVPISDRKYPRILAGIGLLILLLASINFTTLAIGRSVSRAKEVAIRKVAGARRKQLMYQFWTEAILTSMGALLAGILLAYLLLPYFNDVSSKQLSLDLSLVNVLSFTGLAFITGAVAGVYPAMVLSGFSPIRVLKGSISSTGESSKHALLRWLVGFQYFLSIGLIVCTLIMRDQLQYLQNKNLGFDKEQVLVFPYQVAGQRLSEMWADMNNIEVRLKNELNSRADVLGMTTSTHTIGIPGWSQLGFTEQETDRFRRFTTQQIDANYLDLMSIDLKQGKNFIPDEGSDQKAAIVNQAMADQFQLSEPIGATLPGPFMEYQIIGVTDNFQFASLHDAVAPLVMVKEIIPLYQAAPDLVAGDGSNPKISIKIQSNDVASTIAAIQSAWKKVAPEQSFKYRFLDEDLDRQYAVEARLSQIVGLSTILAILIACLGLFGIGLLTIAQRRREIGVRKVLGASTTQILIMLNKKFSIMVILAAVAAIPVTWMIMNKWLNGFEYGIRLSPSVFIIAGLIALILSWIAVGSQSLAAATANPVESIREE